MGLAQWSGEPGGPDDDPEYPACLAALPDIRDAGKQPVAVNIMVVRFACTGMSNAKLRPGLPVADVGNANQLDWMVCQVTTQPLPDIRQIALAPPSLAAGRLNERS